MLNHHNSLTSNDTKKNHEQNSITSLPPLVLSSVPKKAKQISHTLETKIKNINNKIVSNYLSHTQSTQPFTFSSSNVTTSSRLTSPQQSNIPPSSYSSYSKQQSFFEQLTKVTTLHPYAKSNTMQHSSRGGHSHQLSNGSVASSNGDHHSRTNSANGGDLLSQHQRTNSLNQVGPSPESKFLLSDFTICRTLGTGSFGRVHLVQSKHNNKYYAMKVLKKSEVVRLKQVEHTNNEKHILEQVQHPFLVNLWGTFQDSCNLYMVMDYVVGGELFSILRKTQRFPDHVAKFYAAEVILAFEYLHSKDIIYRDLKPENLLLDRNGHIKITDFGFAKYVPDITWTLCGTPDYLAPEIIQSKGYGKAVDWYSLGVLIFEMLAGYPPFYDEDHMRLYEKILAGRIKYPSFFDSDAKDLLKRLLTSDLTKRYGNLKGGSKDIKSHVWFKGVDWDRLLRREIQAPYVPCVNGEGDASNFDVYPEEREPYGKPCNDCYRDKFSSF
ncbi:22175_t:CDS:2 [Dentiscutata erythropus]|uniref:cAMP-dependent protein kinase n=1 Tax=Dentiscutata erythropus TaxID=1348616 RepID=A0A9N9GU12_9GLOM|nr:22175_t:CDS:2 [Dentiscutata erythropus]